MQPMIALLAARLAACCSGPAQAVHNEGNFTPLAPRAPQVPMYLSHQDAVDLLISWVERFFSANNILSTGVTTWPPSTRHPTLRSPWASIAART